MSLTLSTADVAQLTATMRALLAPLEADDPDAWRLRASREAATLLGADRTNFMLPLEGHPPSVSDSADPAALDAYHAYFCQLDWGFLSRRRELGLEVSSMHTFYPPDALPRMELWTDFSLRYRLLDALSVTVDFADAPIPAALMFYHERAGAPAFGERGTALCQLLAPAFRAGVTACRRLAAQARALPRFLDALGEACAVYDRAGRRVHETPALAHRLGAEPEAARLRTAMDRAAQALLALDRPSKSRPADLPLAASSEVRTAAAPYRVRAAFLPEQAGRGGVAVALDRLGAGPLPTASALCAGFGLTRREAEVALLLAQGRSNAEVSRALGVSPHTAERHTERVLAKLGVHSRAAVGAVIYAIGS